MIELKNILVATDFSEPSAVALNYGRDLATSYDATLHVVHVIEDLMAFHGAEIGFAIADVGRNIEAAARRDLENLLNESDRKRLKSRAATIRAPNISHALTEYAKVHAIDLIIVGTHGRGAFHRFLIGSVAERVVRTAPCPVLTVRAHERDFIGVDAVVADGRVLADGCHGETSTPRRASN